MDSVDIINEEIMDLFLATAGCKAVMKISNMAYPRNLEVLTFEEISRVIRKNMRPKKKLVVAERTKFMATKQEHGEPIIKYLHRIKHASRYCEFEKLGQQDQTIEEELIQLRLIEGMCNLSHRCKLLEQLQLGDMSLNACVEFIQQQELIEKFNQNENPNSEPRVAETFTIKKTRRCSFCGYEHERKKEKCPAYGKTCANCLNKNHFQTVCKFKKRNVERMEKNENNKEVFR